MELYTVLVLKKTKTLEGYWNSFYWRSMMLRWALGFFIIALIAAVLGFGGIALAAAGIAKIIFYIFLVLFVISLIGHLASRT